MQTETQQTTDCQESEEDLLKRLEELLPSFNPARGGLIPALQTAQNLFGYLPEEALKLISRSLHIPFSEVTGVVTFYSFFSTVPRGRHVVRACLGTACYVRGGKEVLTALQQELSIGVGETTPDRNFSLEVGRCFGACGLAPVVLVDDDVHQRVKPSKIRELLAAYRHDGEETA